MAGRILFLDVLRGVALILMVVNHTSRWWMDVSMGWGRYYLVYGSVILPAPIFLFLVGFCLPLAPSASGGSRLALAWRYGRRGLTIVGAGLLLNVLVFPEDPWWSGGVLQTIGLSIVLLGPALPFLGRRAVRHALLGLGMLGYLAFAWAYPALGEWVARHPLAAQIWFLDFPPWPWVSAALIGLVLGWVWLDARADGHEARYFRTAAIFGLACVLTYFAWDWWAGTTPRFGFKRDLMLNRHWTPGGATNFLVTGGVALLLAATYWVVEVRRVTLAWLVVVGQTALMLYFLHQFVVLTLVNQALGLRFNHWPLFWAANTALMVLLVFLGKAWLALRRAARRLPLVAPSPP